MTNRLLVVDRNPRDLRVIEVSSRVAGYDVETFTSLEAASAAVLDQAPPDLLIAADDSPEFDAFALCERLKANPGSRDLPILILLQNFTQQGRLRAIAAGADDALAKPISTAEVLHRTHALCSRRGRDRLLSSNTPGPGERTGNLADVPTVDLLAILETWGRSGILRLRTTAGAEAAIYIRGGKPVDAEAGGVSGMAALARIFSWETGTYRIELKNIRRADVLPGTMSDLVMAGMSDRSAWETQLRAGIDRSSILEVNAAVLSEHLAEMSAERNGLLRLCDGQRSVRAVIDASALSDDETLKELTDLLAHGILRPVAVSAAEASPPTTDSMTESGGGDDEPFTAGASAFAPIAASGVAPGDSVDPPLTAPPSATLPLDLEGTEVPEHFTAPVLETPGDRPSASTGSDDDSSSDGALAVIGAQLVPIAQTTVVRKLEEEETTTAVADSLPALLAVSASEPRSHVSAGEGGATAFREPSAHTNGDSTEDFSDEQALEELGLSGRGRRLRWSVAAVAAVALASFGARHWLGQHHAEAVTKVQIPERATKPEAQLPPAPAAEVPPSPTAVVPPAPELPAREKQAPATPAGNLASGHSERAEKLAPEAAREERRRDPAPTRVGQPGARPALVACRMAAEKHGRHHSAKACEEAVSANPHSAEALTLLAHVEMNRGRMKRAQELATKAAEIDPTMADAYAILGGVLQDSGHDHEAKLAYRKYLRLAPNGRYAGELRSIIGTM